MRVRIELVFLPLTLEGMLLSKCGSGMERVAFQSVRTELVQRPCRNNCLVAARLFAFALRWCSCHYPGRMLVRIAKVSHCAYSERIAKVSHVAGFAGAREIVAVWSLWKSKAYSCQGMSRQIRGHRKSFPHARSSIALESSLRHRGAKRMECPDGTGREGWDWERQ